MSARAVSARAWACKVVVAVMVVACGSPDPENGDCAPAALRAALPLGLAGETTVAASQPAELRRLCDALGQTGTTDPHLCYQWAMQIQLRVAQGTVCHVSLRELAQCSDGLGVVGCPEGASALSRPGCEALEACDLELAPWDRLATDYPQRFGDAVAAVCALASAGVAASEGLAACAGAGARRFTYDSCVLGFHGAACACMDARQPSPGRETACELMRGDQARCGERLQAAAEDPCDVLLSPECASLLVDAADAVDDTRRLATLSCREIRAFCATAWPEQRGDTKALECARARRYENPLEACVADLRALRAGCEEGAEAPQSTDGVSGCQLTIGELKTCVHAVPDAACPWHGLHDCVGLPLTSAPAQLDRGAEVRSLNEDQAGLLCRWKERAHGGEGYRPWRCNQNLSAVGVDGVEACVADVLSSYDGCGLTVGELVACSEAMRAEGTPCEWLFRLDLCADTLAWDPCHLLEAFNSCRPLMACVAGTIPMVAPYCHSIVNNERVICPMLADIEVCSASTQTLASGLGAPCDTTPCPAGLLCISDLGQPAPVCTHACNAAIPCEAPWLCTPIGGDSAVCLPAACSELD